MGVRERPFKSYRKLEIVGRFDTPPDTHVRFEGRSHSARSGEPLGLSLLAHGVRVLGRSAKYHRPRGLYCGRGVCGRCSCRVDGLPSQRICVASVHPGCTVSSENNLGTARWDLLAVIDAVFNEGLDHHHLMTESVLLNRAAVSAARALAGLGTLPKRGKEAAFTTREPETVKVQVAIVGAGPAGLAVAEQTCARGLETLVLEALRIDVPDALPVLCGGWVVGLYDDRELLVVRADRQLRVRADVIVLATGGHELAPACLGNDLPGLLSFGAAQRALDLGILPGRNLVVASRPNPESWVERRAASLCEQLQNADANVVATIGFEGPSDGAVAPHATLEALEGTPQVARVHTSGAGELFECDTVVWCARPIPAYELPRQMGVETPFDPQKGGFVPVVDTQGETAREGLFVAGVAAGVPSDQAAQHGLRVGERVAETIRVVS